MTFTARQVLTAAQLNDLSIDTLTTTGDVTVGGTLTATVSAAGSDGQIQYNNGGSFGGASGLVYDDATETVEIADGYLGVGKGNDGTYRVDIGNEGANGNILRLQGADDTLNFTVSAGDYSILNSEQSNGIVIYDGGGGVEIWYLGSSMIDFDSGGIVARSTLNMNSNSITASGGITGLDLSNGISGNNFNITGVNQIEIADPGEGIVWKGGASGDMYLRIVDDASDNILETNAFFTTSQVVTANEFRATDSGPGDDPAFTFSGDEDSGLYRIGADQVALTAGGVTRLRTDSAYGVRIDGPGGYLQIGPANTSYCHVQTDRGKYYFNKRIVVDEGVVSSYNEDLYLQRAESTKIQITSSYIQANDDILPSSSNTLDLGSNSRRWRFVYIDDGIRFDDTSGSKYSIGHYSNYIYLYTDAYVNWYESDTLARHWHCNLNDNGKSYNTAGVWSTLSDPRAKTFIDTPSYFDKVMALQVRKYILDKMPIAPHDDDGHPLMDEDGNYLPVTFEPHPNPQQMLGFNADELEAVMPGLVDYDDWGVKQVKTSILTPMLVQVVQNLNQRLSALESAT